MVEDLKRKTEALAKLGVRFLDDPKALASLQQQGTTFIKYIAYVSSDVSNPLDAANIRLAYIAGENHHRVIATVLEQVLTPAQNAELIAIGSGSATIDTRDLSSIGVMYAVDANINPISGSTAYMFVRAGQIKFGLKNSQVEQVIPQVFERSMKSIARGPIETMNQRPY